MDSQKVHKAVPPMAGLGWGPRLRRGTDLLRFLNKLPSIPPRAGLRAGGMVSNARGVTESIGGRSCQSRHRRDDRS